MYERGSGWKQIMQQDDSVAKLLEMPGKKMFVKASPAYSPTQAHYTLMRL